jgi:hypothetical protein
VNPAHAEGFAWRVGHSKQCLVCDSDWGQLVGVCLERSGVTALIQYEAEMFVLGLEYRRVTVVGAC